MKTLKDSAEKHAKNHAKCDPKVITSDTSTLETRVTSAVKPVKFSYYSSRYGSLIFYAGFKQEEVDSQIRQVDRPEERVKTLRMILDGDYFAAAYKKRIFLEAFAGGRKRFEAGTVQVDISKLTKQEETAFDFFVYTIDGQIRRAGTWDIITPSMEGFYKNLVVLRNFYINSKAV